MPKRNEKTGYRAIMFDYGGVVRSGSLKRHFAATIKDVSKSFGLDPKLAIKEILSGLRHFRANRISELEFWQRFSRKVKRPLPADVLRLWTKNYKLQPDPQMVALVRKFNRAGYKTAVLSNVIEPHYRLIQKSKGYRYFHYVFLSCRVGLQKPNKNFYQYALKKMGVKAREAVFIDDRQDNIETAKKLGIKTILATSKRKVVRELNKLLKQKK